MTAEMLTVADVSRLVGLSEYTVRAAIRATELRAIKLRGRIRIHPDDLAAWVDAGRAAATPRFDEAAVAMTPVPPRRTPPSTDPRAAVRARRRAA